MIDKIPKRIIQTGKTFELPLLSKAAVTNLRLHNPSFEYMFFDNNMVERFFKTEFPEYLDLFHSLDPPIMRYDFFRYLAVYKLGGFYFDLDVFLVAGLDKLLEFDCVFPFEQLTSNYYLWHKYRMDWQIGNYAFGAKPGHPFLLEIIENCRRAYEDPKWVRPMMQSIPRMFRNEYIVFNSTGPGLISRTLAEYHEGAEHIKVLFPENVLDKNGWSQFGDYGVHLMDGTWREKMGRIRRTLIRQWWRREDGKIMKRGSRLGKSRSLEFKRI